MSYIYLIAKLYIVIIYYKFPVKCWLIGDKLDILNFTSYIFDQRVRRILYFQFSGWFYVFFTIDKICLIILSRIFYTTRKGKVQRFICLNRNFNCKTFRCDVEWHQSDVSIVYRICPNKHVHFCIIEMIQWNVTAAGFVYILFEIIVLFIYTTFPKLILFPFLSRLYM